MPILLQPEEQELKWKQRSSELLQRWQESCSKLHPHSAVQTHRRKPVAFSVSPALFLRPTLSIPGAIPTLKINSYERTASPPDSPVKTDLVLGQLNPSSTTMIKVHRNRIKDSVGSEKDDADPRISELDSFKRLFHGLTERVGWQPEAASAIAKAVVRCKSGHGKPRHIPSKRAIWLLFNGSDKVGKLKMAASLSELMFGTTPITIRLTDKNYFDSNRVLRGKISMDRVADALCRNPFSVIIIEDINSANDIAKSTIKSAVKTGRLSDSHGREISLESAIFILLTDDSSSPTHYEEKILESARSEWSLEFAIVENVGKRHAEWLCKDERSVKRLKESPSGLCLDLNLSTCTEDENEDPAEGSGNSSDLTVEHEQKYEHKRLVIKKLVEPTVVPLSWAAAELPKLVDEVVLFQPVDFTSVKRKLTEFIRSKFNTLVGHEHSLRVEEDALEKIMAGLWLAGGGIHCNGLEEWAEKTLVPGIHHLKACVKATAGPVIVQLKARKVKRDVSREWELLPVVS